MQEFTIKLLESFDSNIQELDISKSKIEGILDLSKFVNITKSPN